MLLKLHNPTDVNEDWFLTRFFSDKHNPCQLEGTSTDSPSCWACSSIWHEKIFHREYGHIGCAPCSATVRGWTGRDLKNKDIHFLHLLLKVSKKSVTEIICTNLCADCAQIVRELCANCEQVYFARILRAFCNLLHNIFHVKSTNVWRIRTK